MPEDNQNSLVLELLRAIRTDMSEVKERLERIEVRLTGVESYVGHLVTQGASDREAMAALTRRVERIERRLELRDDA